MQAMEDRELIVKTSAYIDRHRDEMLSLWEKIVSIESGTPDKEGVDRVGAVLKDELESAGVETAVIPMERFGNLLTGVWNKEAAGQPIVLIGHMDTVFAKGTLEKNPFRIDENGNAHGPGVLDMKAGLVIVVYVLKALHEYGYGKRPIRVVFAGDEENGHRQTNAEAEIRKLCAGCAAAFNFETGFIDDGLVVGRKGSCRVTLTVHGVAAHAGNDPQRGRNAILEMAHKIIEIQKLHDFEHGLFVNVGVIQGGTVANAVAASCEVGIDIRYDSFERLEETLQAIKKIAEEGPCVLVGRCADYALEERDDVLSVFIHADMDKRIAAVMARDHINSRLKAKRKIEEIDEKRSTFRKEFTGEEWGQSKYYNLSIDTTHLSYQQAADLILYYKKLAEEAQK